MTNENLHSIKPSSTESKEQLESLIQEWLPRLHNAQIGHYTRSETLYWRADVFGYALIFSSTVVTAMLFLQTDGFQKILLIAMSIISAMLSGVVSFARFAEKAEQHRSAAGTYGKLRRQLEKLDKTTHTLTFQQLDSKLKVLRIEWEYVSQNAPLTPSSAIVKQKKGG